MKIITVIIPEYNRGEDLVATIESLIHCDRSKFDLVVVDQTKKHSDEVLSRLAELEAEFPMKWLRGVKPNLTRARNIGLKESSTAFVLYVDDDVLVEPDFICQYVKAIEKLSLIHI